MTEAQIIETCPRCDTIIEDEEFEHEHYVYEELLHSNADEQPSLEDFEAAPSGATVVDTCPTCGNIVED